MRNNNDPICGEYEFPTTDSFICHCSLFKESRDIRISLNVVRSTQIINEVLYKKILILSQKGV